MIRGTRQRPARSIAFKVFGLNKDFPMKDYGKKRGWDYSFTVCTCGNILYADKTYCKACKGKVWGTVKCSCKKPMR